MAPQNHVLRLDVPVDGGHGVEHPQPLTQMLDNLPGLRLGKQGVFQQKVQGVPLNKLLNHQIFPILLRHLVDHRQVAAGAVQQLPVDLPVAGKTAENELPAALPVPDELHAAPGALL